MKKLIMVLLMVLGFSGCSHSYVRSWNQESNQITVCCPSHKIFCSADKRHDLAEKQCSGPARAIAGGLIDSGALYDPQTNYARSTTDSCTVFRCGN